MKPFKSPDSASAIPLAGLALYILASPLYVFPQGAPQPADVLLIAVVGITYLLAWRRIPDQPGLYASLALFIGWIVLVNSFWFLFTYDARLMLKTLYYIFNALVFIFVVGLALRDFDSLRTVVWWCGLVALVLEVAYVEFLYFGVANRGMGSFNNPNQFAYWALLILACLGIARGRERLGIADLLWLALGGYAIVVSASRAALAAGALLIATIVVSCGLRRITTLVLVAGLGLGLGLELVRGGMAERIVEVDIVGVISNRMSKFGEDPQDSLLKRGYVRLIENPEHLVFGAGEGAFTRLKGLERTPNREFHSTLGNTLMSYGLIGLALFGIFLFATLSLSSWPSIVYFGAIMLYGVSHMGLRDSLFWIFLALAFAQGRVSSSEWARRSGLTFRSVAEASR